MSSYGDRHEQLRDLAERAEKVMQDFDDGWPDDATRDGTRHILAFSKTVIEASDAELVSSNAASQLTNALNQFATGDPATSAVNADAYAGAVLDAIALLPAARSRDFEQSVKDSVANVRRAASMHIHNLDEEREQIATKLASLGDDLAAMRDELTTSVAQQRTEISAEIAAARAPFDQEVEQARQQLASEQSSLSKLRTKQTAEFEEAEERRNATAKEQREETATELNAFLAASKTEVEQRVADVERMQEDVRKMVDAVSLAATTEGYGKEATRQGTTANAWRWITVAAALGAAAIAFLAVRPDEIDREVLIGKLVLSLILGGIAAYAAKQSGYHRNREQIARDLQLELAIFGPFIERLDPAQQQEERVQMTRKTFGHVRPASQTTGETPTVPSDSAAGASTASGVDQSPSVISIVAQEAIAAIRSGATPPQA